MKKIIRRSFIIFNLKARTLSLFVLLSVCPILAGEQIIHRVDAQDTLFGISLLYNTSVDRIKEENDLSSELIRTGEELIIPLGTLQTGETNENEASLSTYKVKRGDTLSEIASSLGLEQKQIIQLNSLSDNSLRIDQVLLIPGKASAGGYYIVKSGDTLSKISLLFDISQEQLRQINSLITDSLTIGEKIKVAPEHPQAYIVQKGDSLWDIAQQQGMKIDELIAFNKIENERIYPGQELKLYPFIVDDFEMPEKKTTTLLANYAETPLEEYMNYEDSRQFQPSREYAETELDDPVTNYNQARAILASFDQTIDRERRLSNDLAGYHIVIDPGHGGLDPGAIVPSVNGNGETVYVVEDEYAYDISLRTYRLLKLHGAEVTLTIISPNHQIRHSSNPSETFVNMKNEVYNFKAMNRAGDDGSWPVGGSQGLRKRVEIAETAFAGVDKKKTLFISIHADNSPDHGQGTMVLYSSEEEKNIEESKKLAEALVPYMGASSTTGTQNLAVLRDNPAWAEVLIEIRNLHYPGNSWAIRYDKLREQDARFIAEGLRNYAGHR
ncbi:MAG: LysM peptidoglycan-binding domain-containing protein [Spirochaetaceae bacterium]|nr:LysM peptidoglycan-binding domain-containing protein [Spirochaetaceae bacterium]